MPPPTDYVFELSVRACVLPGVCPVSAQYLKDQWTKFHQTLVDEAVDEATDELIRF